MSIKDQISTNKNYFITSLLIIILFTVLSSIVFEHMDFISDDYFLLKASLVNAFPYNSDWIGTGNQFLRPVIISSYYINYCISGFNSYYYYLTNLIIHLFNSFILANILFYVLGKQLKITIAFRLSLITMSVFLILPQNISNVFWIAGRTDLIMSAFLFLSIFYGFKYLFENRNHYLVLLAVFMILSFLSKETTLIIIFYILIGLVYINNYATAIKKRYYYISSITVIIILLYFAYRYFIFSMLFGNTFYENSILNILKYYFYGIFTLLLPIDFVDYYTLIVNENILFFISLLIVILVIVFTVFSIFSSTPNKIRIIALSVISLLSLLIYVKSFPSMRLMYSHIPLLIFPIIELFKNKNTEIKHHKNIFILAYIILLLIGISSSFYKSLTVGTYMNTYENLLTVNNKENNYKIINLASVISLGQNWIAPESNIIYEIINHKNISEVSLEIVTTPMGIQINGFWSKIDDVKYETNGINEITVKLKNDIDVIKATNEISYNIKFVNNYYLLKNGIEIFCIERNILRNDYLKSIKIKIPKEYITKNTDVIYIRGNELQRNKILDFLKEFNTTY